MKIVFSMCKMILFFETDFPTAEKVIEYEGPIFTNILAHSNFCIKLHELFINHDDTSSRCPRAEPMRIFQYIMGVGNESLN